MKVKDIMTTKIQTCSPSNAVEDAAKIMIEEDFSAIPIVDKTNKLLGLVTESDFVGQQVDIPHSVKNLKELFGSTFDSRNIQSIYASAKKKSLEEVMTTNLTTLSKDAELFEVIDLMLRKNLKRLPVAENDQLLGIVTRKDLLKTFYQTPSDSHPTSAET
jgi:CBS domain-containing protein